MITLLAGSLAFVACGVWLLPNEPFIAATTILFFGLCALVAAIGLHPKSSFLTLTTHGFIFASLFRKHFVPWSDVQSFTPTRIGGNKMVGWNYMPSFSASMKLRRANIAISGVEAAFPDTYGMSAEDLSALLNKLHKAYSNAL